MPTDTTQSADPTTSAPSTSEATLGSTSESEMEKILNFADGADNPLAPAKPAETVQDKPIESTPEQPPDALTALAAARKPTPGSRKYDNLSPDEIEIFKNMSNTAYDRLYPMFLEHKGIQEKLTSAEQKLAESAKPARYYDHPEAYRLSEEYSQLQQIDNQVEAVRSFWQDQLGKVEAGEQFSVLEQDPTTGALRASAPRESSPQAKAYIISKITQADVDRNTVAGQLRSFQGEFKQRFTERDTALQGIFKKLFGQHEELLKPAAEKELQNFPEFFRPQVESKMLAYGLSTLRSMSEVLKERDKEIATLKANGQISKSAGPTMSTIQTGPGTSAASNLPNDQEYKMLKGQFGL